jgi:hypothetical protein
MWQTVQVCGGYELLYNWIFLFIVSKLGKGPINTELVDIEPLPLEEYRTRFLWASSHISSTDQY